jgi:hypothetical protein
MPGACGSSGAPKLGRISEIVQRPGKGLLSFTVTAFAILGMSAGTVTALFSLNVCDQRMWEKM